MKSDSPCEIHACTDIRNALRHALMAVGIVGKGSLIVHVHFPYMKPEVVGCARHGASQGHVTVLPDRDRQILVEIVEERQIGW